MFCNAFVEMAMFTNQAPINHVAYINSDFLYL